MCLRVRERELDGLRCSWRLTPQDRGIEIEKNGDELLAILQRGRLDDLRLKLHGGFTEQPRLLALRASTFAWPRTTHS